MKYNIKLTMLAIMRFETLADKSFLDCDHANEADQFNLLYAAYCANNEQVTERRFRTFFDNKKVQASMLREFAESLALIQTAPTGSHRPASQSQTGHARIGDIVPALIAEALKPDYALYRMTLDRNSVV